MVHGAVNIAIFFLQIPLYTLMEKTFDAHKRLVAYAHSGFYALFF